MKIKACPSCRGICKVRVECTFIAGELRHRAICDCCGYRSGGKPTESKAIEAHNRLSELAGAEVVEIASCEGCKPYFEYIRDMNARVPVCKKQGKYLGTTRGLEPDCPLRKRPVVFRLSGGQDG